MSPLKALELQKAMAKLGGVVRRAGENNYEIYVSGRQVARVTVPSGRKEMKHRTFKSACEQAGLSISQMFETHRCSFGRREYEDLWRSRLPQ